MGTEHPDFWEHLITKIEPIMYVGENLMEETTLLIEKYQIGLTSITDWKSLPIGFRNELQSCIRSLTEHISAIPLIGGLLEADVVYLCVFEELEIQFSRLDKNDVAARTYLLHLMEEVMDSSISTGTMKLSDWHGLLEKRKKATRVENAGEYVYKKLCAEYDAREKMCVYDFFYNKTSQAEIDGLLCKAKDSLLLAFAHRGKTKKRGQGMSRFIIDCIHQWQNAELMKPLKSVFPFCQCLQQYWNNEINLGTRQGLEATYKQRL